MLQFSLSLSVCVTPSPSVVWSVIALSDDYFVSYLYHRVSASGTDS
jgi:hypothetical protein